MDRFKDKVCIVTGGAGHIGSAVVKKLASEGGKVAIVDLNKELLNKTYSAMKAKDYDIISVETDVTSRSSVQRMVKTVLAHWGRIDLLANVAGGGKNAWITEMTEEEWTDIINLNLTGTFNCIQAVVNIMAENGGGKIVNTSSTAINGVIWFKQAKIGRSNYAAAKAGLIGLTRTLSMELAEYNININTVIPGPIMTPKSRAGFERLEKDEKVTAPPSTLIPLGRYGTPEDVANAIAFLLSDEASYITGSSLYVSGGLQ